ncbi:MAG TPA: HXXEE domain-containing protein [Steroidobacteraceae bacterium]|nr:HXXEE domain-containing protein [Steroidobacteraceae bacterium]
MNAASRVVNTFGALVLAQAAHSTEESIGQLWVSFPPARFVSGLVATNPEHGFVFLNICIVALGAWCYFWPVRRQWRIATPIIWLWTVIEMINGVVHPSWSILQRGYTPGVITAPVLLVLALYLATLQHRSSGATR